MCLFFVDDGRSVVFFSIALASWTNASAFIFWASDSADSFKLKLKPGLDPDDDTVESGLFCGLALPTPPPLFLSMNFMII
jgi:hypothetical protein